LTTVAIERIVAGLEKKSRILSREERRRVAYHEMGHAFLAATLPGVDPVHKVSIIPRGVGALGYTMQRPTEDRFLLARHDLKHRVQAQSSSNPRPCVTTFAAGESSVTSRRGNDRR
jgi:cell division protease FtsH